MAQTQIQIGLNFQADTKQAQAQIKDLYNSLTKISMMTPAEGMGMKFTQQIRQASSAAAELGSHLKMATNIETGKIDFSKLNQSLKSSGISLQSYVQKIVSVGPQGQQAFMQLSRAIMNSEIPVRKVSAGLEKMFTTLKNTARWQLSSSIMQGFTQAVSTAYNYAKDLNESLNNIRIVTGKSIDDMAKFATQANKAAKALSTTTTAYSDASLIFYQQGLDGADVTKRTDTVIKMANVTSKSAAEVSDQMTAVWNNFYDGSKSLEYYADAMTALGAATASSTDEISQGLEKFASVAETVGLSYEYATAALATVTAKTRQSADVVGTAFKTLFARIQDLELGETLDDGVTLGKYSEALEAVGINIMQVNGEVKDMNDILDEMGNKWGDLTKAQQVSLAQTVAGTRQYTQLVSLMDNYSDFKINVGIAETSSGTLNKQQEIYEESWEAASKRVKASMETIFSQLIDDKFFIGLTNALSKVLDVVSKLVDSFGGLKGVISALGGILLQTFAGKAAQGLENMATSLKTMTPSGRAVLQKEKQNQLNKMTETAQAELSRRYGSNNLTSQTAQNNIANELDLQQRYLTIEENLDQIQKDRLKTQLDIAKAANDEAIAAAQTLDNIKLTKEAKESSAIGSLLASNLSPEDLADKDTSSLFYDEYKNKLNNARNMSGAAAHMNIAQQQLTSGEFAVTSEGLTSLAAELDKMGPTAQGFADSLRDLAMRAKDGKTPVDNLEQEFKELAAQAKGTSEQLKNELVDSVSDQDGKNAVSDYVDQGKREIQAQNAHAAAVRKNAAATQEFGDIEKEVAAQTPKMSQSIVQAASATMQLFSAFSALSSIWETMKDPDMTGWQKFTSIVSSLSMTIMMLGTALPGLKGFKDIFGGFTVEGINKRFDNFAEAAAKKEAAQATLLQEKAEKRLQRAKAKSASATRADTAATKEETKANLKNAASEELKNKAEKTSGGINLVDAEKAGYVPRYHKGQLQGWLKKGEGGSFVGKLGTVKKKGGGIAPNGFFSDDDVIKDIDALSPKEGNLPGGTSTGGTPTGGAPQKAKLDWGKLGQGIKSYAAMYGPLIVAVGALAVGLTMAGKAWNKHNIEAKKASELAKQASEAYDRLKQSYTELDESSNKYSEISESLKTMTKNTAEYKIKLAEANDEALKLVNKYGDMLEYSTGLNGEIQITEESLNRVKEHEASLVQSASLRSMQASQEARNAELHAKRVEFNREYAKDSGVGSWDQTDAAGAWMVGGGVAAAGAVVGGYALAASAATIAAAAAAVPVAGWVVAAVGALVALAGVVVGAVGKESTKNEQNALDDLADAYLKSGKSNAALTEQSMRATLEQQGYSEDLINSLMNNKEATQELIREIAANTEAIRINNIAQAEQKYGDILDRSNLDGDTRDNVANAIMTNEQQRVNEIYEEQYKDKIGGKTDAEIQKEYAEMMGYSVSKTENKSGNKAIYFDKQGNEVGEISDEEVRKALAQKAYDEGEGAQARVEARKITNLVKEANAVSENVGEAISTFAGGEDNIDLGKLTKEQLYNVTEAVENFKITDESINFNGVEIDKNDVQALGYDTLEEFVNALDKAAQNSDWDKVAETAMKDTLDDFTAWIDEYKATHEHDFVDQLTKDQRDALLNQYHAIREKYGTETADNFMDTAAEAYSHQDSTGKNTYDTLMATDYSSTDSINETFNYLGKEIPGLTDTLGDLRDQVIDVNDAVSNFSLEGINNEIAKIDTAKTLTKGSTVDDSYVNGLPKEAQAYFEKNKEGKYELIGDPGELLNILQNNFTENTNKKTQGLESDIANKTNDLKEYKTGAAATLDEVRSYLNYYTEGAADFIDIAPNANGNDIMNDLNFLYSQGVLSETAMQNLADNIFAEGQVFFDRLDQDKSKWTLKPVAEDSEIVLNDKITTNSFLVKDELDIAQDKVADEIDAKTAEIEDKEDQLRQYNEMAVAQAGSYIDLTSPEYTNAMTSAIAIEDKDEQGTAVKRVLDQRGAGLINLAKQYDDAGDAIVEYKKVANDTETTTEELQAAQEVLMNTLRDSAWKQATKDIDQHVDVINDAKSSAEQIDQAYAGIAQSMNQHLGTSVSADWVKENIGLINQWKNATGDEATELGMLIQQYALLNSLPPAELEVKAETAGFDSGVEYLNAVKTALESNPITINAEGEADLSGLINQLAATGMSAQGIADILTSFAHTKITLGVDGEEIDLTTQEGMEAFLGRDDLATIQVTSAQVPSAGVADMSNYSGGETKSDGAGKEVKDKKKSDEVTKYDRITHAIEKQEKALDKLSKAKDRANGPAKVVAIQNEIDAMEEQLELYKKQAEEIEEVWDVEASTLQKNVKDLIGMEVEYDEQGFIENQNELEEAMVEWFNANKNDENAEENYSLIKEGISAVEEAVNERLNNTDKQDELLEQIRDAQYEQLEAFYQYREDVFRNQIDYKEWTKEMAAYNPAAYREYRTAEAMVTSNFLNDQFATYDKLLNDQGSKVIQFLNTAQGEGFRPDGEPLKDMDDLLKALRSTEDKDNPGEMKLDDFIALMASGQNETIDNYLKNSQDYISELNDKLTDYIESINDAIEEQFDHFDKFNEQVDSLTDTAEHYLNIVDLIGRQKLGIDDTLFKDMNTVIVEANASALLLAQEEKNAADALVRNIEEQMKDNSIEEGSAEWDMWNKKLEEAVARQQEAGNALQESIAATIESITSAFEAAINSALDTFNKAISGKAGNNLSEMFNRQKEISSRYLADYQKIYELSKLSRQITNSIDDTDNIKSKRLLKDLEAQIAEYQEEGKDMSQYQLTYLQKQYDLRLAQIALEEAQNAKSTVRLTRDNEGNYSYTYVANDDNVADAQQKYEDALYASQSTSNEYINELQDNILSSQEEMASKIAELDPKSATYKEDVQALQEYYLKQIEYYKEQMQIAFNNNGELYNNDWQNYSLSTGYKMSSNEEWIDSFDETTLGIETGFDSLEEYYDNFAVATQDLVNTVCTEYDTMNTRVDYVLNITGTSIEDFKEKAWDELINNNNDDSVVNSLRKVDAEAGKMADETIGALDKIIEGFGEKYKDLKGQIDTWVAEVQRFSEAWLATQALMTEVDKNNDYMQDAMDIVATNGGKLNDQQMYALQWLWNMREKKIQELTPEEIEDLGGLPESYSSFQDFKEALEQRTQTKITNSGANATVLEQSKTPTGESKVDPGRQINPEDGPENPNNKTKINISFSYLNSSQKPVTVSVGNISPGISFKDSGLSEPTIIKIMKKGNDIVKFSKWEPSFEDILNADTIFKAQYIRFKAINSNSNSESAIPEGFPDKFKMYEYKNGSMSFEAGEKQYHLVHISDPEDSSNFYFTARGNVSEKPENGLYGFSIQNPLLYGKGTSVSIDELNTGGYTGKWDSSGRLAILHQKELVLNAHDTENFLTATDVLRKIVQTIDLNTLNSQYSNLLASNIAGMSNQIDQNVHIEASFPNVTDHNEIELALTNLVNEASQYAFRNNR